MFWAELGELEHAPDHEASKMVGNYSTAIAIGSPSMSGQGSELGFVRASPGGKSICI